MNKKILITCQNYKVICVLLFAVWFVDLCKKSFSDIEDAFSKYWVPYVKINPNKNTNTLQIGAYLSLVFIA